MIWAGRGSIRNLVIALGLLVGVHFAAPLAEAQPPLPRVSFGQETHAFRRLIFDLKLEPLASLKEVAEDPAHTLVVSLGKPDLLNQLHLRFLEKGGSVLMASDVEQSKYLGFTVTGLVSVRPGNSSAAYRGHYFDCPIIQSAEENSPPIFKNCNRVVANRAGILRHDEPRVWSPAHLGRFPNDCFNYNRPILNAQLFAVGGKVGSKGRAILVSDHSVFINDMMLQPDNDNLEFAYNCLNWLVEGDEPKTRVLFIEDNIIRSEPSDFNIPLKSVPVPDLVTWTNTILSELENEDVFNRLLLEKFGGESILRFVMIVSTLGLLAFGALRLNRARHRFEKGVPMLGAVAASAASSLSVLEQRQQALLATGNLWEAARERARQVFEPFVGVLPEAGKTPTASIHVAGFFWRRWRVGRMVRRLWNLAYGKGPVQVSRRDFTRIVSQLREIKTALITRTVRLEVSPSDRS